jgi:transposase
VLLGRKVPEESVTGSEQKSNTSKRYTAEQAGCRRAGAVVGQDGHRGRPGPGGEPGGGALTSAELEELAQLRRKVRELEKTVDILGKATSFFAQDKMR